MAQNLYPENIDSMTNKERIEAARKFFDNLDEYSPSAAVSALAEHFKISETDARRIVYG